MRLVDKSVLFQEAWRCCLNNYSCRRLVMASIGIPGVLHAKSTTFRPVWKKRRSMCVVKIFGSECHWLTIVSQTQNCYVYNIHEEYDTRDILDDLTARIAKAGHDIRLHIFKSPNREDGHCQTWSIACLYAHHHNLSIDDGLFDMVSDMLWQDDTFKFWVRREMGRMIKSVDAFSSQSTRNML